MRRLYTTTSTTTKNSTSTNTNKSVPSAIHSYNLEIGRTIADGRRAFYK